MVPPEPLGDGGDKNSLEMVVDVLKLVAGLLLGVVGAAVLIALALWHLVSEMDRIDKSNDE